MDKTDRDSFFSTGITFGECIIRCLIFTDDLALLSSNENDLQYAFYSLSEVCLNAGMKISTAKTEITCVCQDTLTSVFFQTNGVTLQQMDKFKYLGATFSSDDRHNNKL